MDISLIFNFITAFISLFLPWLASPGTPVNTPADTVAEVVSVIDGDTIIVNIDGRQETVRYIGIDTPEPRREGASECGSHEATEYNRELVAGQTVRLVADAEDRDQYDRLLRYVYVGEGTTEVFVNEVIVTAGLATPLTIKPNNTHARTFNEAARDAEADDIGNWALCGE
ncbi:MAG: thermonuclease family protein [Candidatus Pacebacteria bacterium]|nr:thermonuclease family protein [Candidatus Paceibacterota bacterium]